MDHTFEPSGAATAGGDFAAYPLHTEVLQLACRAKLFSVKLGKRARGRETETIEAGGAPLVAEPVPQSEKHSKTFGR